VSVWADLIIRFQAYSHLESNKISLKMRVKELRMFLPFAQNQGEVLKVIGFMAARQVARDGALDRGLFKVVGTAEVTQPTRELAASSMPKGACKLSRRISRNFSSNSIMVIVDGSFV
jgi:hypothetical protein